MKTMKIILALLFVAFCLPASARMHGGSASPYQPVVIHNYNGAGFNDYNQISHLDTAGDQIDVHDGQMLQVGSTIYNIGASYGCGFNYPQATNPWCGFPIYVSNAGNPTQPDLLHWTKVGFLFDGTTPTWQTNCGTSFGCWGLHGLYNAATSKFVFWFVGTGAPGATENFYLFTCDPPPTPGANFANCAQGTSPHNLAHSPGDDFHLFLDPISGNGYILYANVSGGNVFTAYIDQLNSSFTDSNGTSIHIADGDGTVPEGFGMIYNAGSPRPYVIVWSGGCPYCQSTISYSETATSPMGTYANFEQINSTSCGGQARSVDSLTAGGITTHMYQSEQWEPFEEGNEGMANIYYQPLSFDGSGSIIPFSCATQVSVPGFVTTSAAPPVPPVGADQQNFGDMYNAFADFSSPTIWRMQTFVPTVSTLSKIRMPLGQAYNSNLGLSADPIIQLVSLDGSNNPVTVLASATVPRTSLAWSLKMTDITFNYSGLTPGTPYGIILRNPGTGLIAQALYTAGNSYPAGVERYTSNGGSTWTTEANRALEFATFP